MALSIKKAGAYSAATGVFVKKSGVYSAVAGMFVKAAGVYNNILQFIASSIVIDGDAPVINYAIRSADLTGISASRQGSASFWIQPLYDSGVDAVVVRFHGQWVQIQMDLNKRLSVRLSDGPNVLQFRTASAITPATAESHFAISWNTNFAAGLKQFQILKNGVSDVELVSDASVAFTPIMTGQIASIGATNAGALIGIQTVRELMYWPGVQIDWAANIGKVYSAGNAVDPGPAGALVTGTAPAVYLSLRGGSAASTFLTNRGTGGDFAQRAGSVAVRADTQLVGYGDSLLFGTSSSAYPSKTWMWLTCVGLNTPRRDINYGHGGYGTAAIASWMASGTVSPFVVPSVAAANAAGANIVWMLEGGYNDLAGSAATINTNIANMVSALLSAVPNAKYIIMGIPNSGVAAEQPGGAKYTVLTAVNANSAALYGSHFLDLKGQLISRGLALAGLSATAFDTADIALDTVPSSLRDGTPPNGSVHWNDYGEIAVSKLVIEKMQALGYD